MSPIQVQKKATYTGHRDCIYALELGAEPEVFYTSGGDGMVVRWDTRQPDQGDLIVKVENSIYAFVPDLHQNKLYLGHNYRGVHVVDLLSKKEIASTAITTAAIYSMQLVGHQLWIGAGDGIVYVIDKNDLSTLAKIHLSNQNIRQLCVTLDGKYMLAGSSDTLIYVIRMADFAIEKPISGHTNSIFALAMDKEGSTIVSGGRDAHLKKWDYPGFKEVTDVAAHMYAINDIQLSPSGKYFATGSMDKSIKLWEADSLKLLKVIDKARHAGHGTSVNKVRWMGSDEELISVSDDRTVSLWTIQYSK
ncbi:MAG: WD40 repeat domain-containing protein [Cytophagaceae bacterium]